MSIQVDQRGKIIPPNEALYQNFTDLGNGERFATKYGGIIRYCPDFKCWLVWDGRHWGKDMGTVKVSFLAKLTIRDIYRQAADEPSDEMRKALIQHAQKSESNHRIEAMIKLTQSEPNLPIRASEFDSDNWLFNCNNGTIDLKTGELLPHSRDDYLTKLVEVDYDPDAQCPRWLSFLERVTDGNTGLQSYLQRGVGYSLTGETKSQVLFFLYGLGNNGKSTFVTTIRKLVGVYGERVGTDLFMLREKNSTGPKEGLANLKGKRFVVASELEDGKRLAISLVKDMTGGETIKADRKYEHEVEYQPTHKLWLVGNHKPVITDTTLSIWRRVKLIPFTVTILDKEIDQELPAKLEEELSGILAWAVRGCLEWQQSSLSEPDTVILATASYRHEQDILGDFIEDCCVLEALAQLAKADLKDAYQSWCQDNSVEPVTQRTFRARLVEKGVTDGKSGAIRYWKGITTRSLVLKGQENVPNSNTIGTKQTEIPEVSICKDIQEKFLEIDVTLVPNVPNDDLPEYPTNYCPACKGGDYRPTDDNRWLCSRCHPDPKLEVKDKR